MICWPTGSPSRPRSRGDRDLAGRVRIGPGLDLGHGRAGRCRGRRRCRGSRRSRSRTGWRRGRRHPGSGRRPRPRRAPSGSCRRRPAAGLRAALRRPRSAAFGVSVSVSPTLFAVICWASTVAKTTNDATRMARPVSSSRAGRRATPRKLGAQHAHRCAPRFCRASVTDARVGPVDLAGHPAVGQQHHPVGVRGRGRVVGDHDDGLAQLADRVAQERQHLGAGAGVEVAGRLVGEDHLGPRHQRPGQRDPLLLAAGQLARAGGRAGRSRPSTSARWANRPRSGVAAGQVQRQRDVLRRGELRQQVERLEDEADPLPAHPGEHLVATARSGRCRRAAPGPRWRCPARPGSASAWTCRSRTGP